MNHWVERKVAQALVIRTPKNGTIDLQNPQHHNLVWQIIGHVNTVTPPVERILFEEQRRAREAHTPDNT